MKVLLIKAPYRDVYGPIKLAAGNYFLLGIGYIAGFLRKHGHEVAIFDPEAQGMDLPELIERSKRFKPNLVGISATSPDFAAGSHIAAEIKKKTGAFILLGGIHGSSLPEFIMQEYGELFDAVCVGEGEFTSLDLCRYLQKQIPSLREINGLCFREKGKIIRTPPRPFIEDLDSLPFPARDLVDLSLYRPHAFNFRKGRTATIITSRGCPFRCTFCASKLTLGGRFRARSPGNVLAEIRHLVNDYGINHLLIHDDTFTFDAERAKEICRRIIAENIKIEWFSFSQISGVDEELICLMKNSGCYSIGFGVESADEAVLKNIRKASTVKQCEFVIRTANSYGIKTQAFFIIGSKGDTAETIKKTLRFARRVSPTLAFFNKLVPYPGTEIFHEHFGADLRKINWTDFVPYGVGVVSSTKELDKHNLQRWVFKANLIFYFRPAQIMAIIKTIRSFSEFREYARAAIALFLQLVAWQGRGRE